MIAYGNCASTGGIFALANQKGHDISPLNKIIKDSININGCLGEIEELKLEIDDKDLPKLKNLCNVCGRQKTCDYLEEVKRQIELEDNRTCFNDLGYLCNGFVSRECKERCIDYNAPCRGCKPIIERSGIRMLGMFGTLMGNIEVATEATGKGGTDKLADEDDDVTDSFPDLTGSFFRFNLANTILPIGKNASTGNILSDVFIGRTIEELPMITGLLGGSKAISLTIKAIEAYEKGANLEVSDQTVELRKNLLELEKELNKAAENEDIKAYGNATHEIRKIAGNMNLSNIFFGGFRMPIEGEIYEKIKYHIFDFEEDTFEGEYENGPVKYTLDPSGVITEFEMEV